MQPRRLRRRELAGSANVRRTLGHCQRRGKREPLLRQPPGFRPLQGGVLRQNRRLESLQARARVDTEFLGEGRFEFLVGPQCVGLPGAAIKRGDPQRPQSLVQRFVAAQRLQLAQHGGVTATGKLGLEPRLLHRPALLGDPNRSGPQRLGAGVGDTVAAPQPERGAQCGRCLGWSAGGQCGSSLPGKLLESVEIGLADAQHVARRTGLDHLRCPGRGERATNPRHQHPDRHRGRRWGLRIPQRRDQLLDRHHTAVLQRESDQQATLLVTADRYPAIVAQHFERPKDPDHHHHPATVTATGLQQACYRLPPR